MSRTGDRTVVFGVHGRREGGKWENSSAKIGDSFVVFGRSAISRKKKGEFIFAFLGDFTFALDEFIFALLSGGTHRGANTLRAKPPPAFYFRRI